MARGSDVRGRMVEAGQELLSRRGYGMTLLDVVEKAAAPRGSIYYHFPSGKEELAIEVAAKTASELERLAVSMGRKNADPVAFLQALVDHHTSRLVTSGFDEGCPLMAITVSSDTDSAELKKAVAGSFSRWIEGIAGVLREKGLAPDVSENLATTTVAGVEGAIVIARATRSSAPLEQFRNALPALIGGLHVAV